MFKSLSCWNSLLRVKNKHFAYQIYCFCCRKMFVQISHKIGELLLFELVIAELIRHFQAILQVKFQKFVRTENFNSLDKLLKKIFAQNKGVFLKNDGSKYHSCSPNVDWVVIIGVFQYQLWGFEKSTIHFMTFFLFRLVEYSLSKINQLHFFSIVFVENVLRLQISKYNSLWVNIVKNFKQVSHVSLNSFQIKFSKVTFKLIKLVMLQY